MRENRTAMTPAQQFRRQCFGYARHTFDQDMTIRENAGQQQLDHLLLTYNHFADLQFQCLYLLAESLELGSLPRTNYLPYIIFYKKSPFVFAAPANPHLKVMIFAGSN